MRALADGSGSVFEFVVLMRDYYPHEPSPELARTPSFMRRASPCSMGGCPEHQEKAPPPRREKGWLPVAERHAPSATAAGPGRPNSIVNPSSSRA